MGKLWTWALAFLTLAMAVAPGARAQANFELKAYERGIADEDADTASALIQLREFKADVRVAGPLADVTLEFLLGIDSDDEHEIRLALALPNEAVVTGYALDIDGKLIPGQLLESPRARNVYEDEVREGIDPGLAEVSAENRFTTRIFPVSRDKPRRIRVQFSAPFDPAKGLVLPFDSGVVAGQVALSVRIEGYTDAPILRWNGKPLALVAEGSKWSGGLEGRSLALTSGLAIAGGSLASAMQVVRHANGREFFVIADRFAALPAAPDRGGRLRVYWDRSLSHRDDLVDQEVDVLAALVDGTAPEAIDLVTFASDRPVVTEHLGSASLRKALAGITYRGGSSLAGLDELALPEAARCVMVFDGQVTLDHAADFAPDCALAIFTSAKGADGTRLGRIAQRSGGRFSRLEAGGGRELAAALARPLPGGVTVRDAARRKLSYRALPAAEGTWLLVGEMPVSGEVKVRFAGGGKAEERSYIDHGAALRGDAAGALWANQALSELTDDPARHEDMVALARQFQVAGPAMSFLVLEQVEQYVRNEIDPPKGFSEEWMEEYREARSEHDEERAEARTERFDEVLEAWEERKEWWGKTFVVAKRSRKSEDKEEIGNDSAVPTPPAPSPPSPGVVSPAPPAVADAGASAGDCDICVTATRRPVQEQSVPVAVTMFSGDDADVIVTTATRIDPGGTNRVSIAEKDIGLNLENVLSNRPYLAALESAPRGKRLVVLGEQELAYGTVPTFYLDTAEWFRLKGDKTTARLLLHSALEIATANDETRQIVGFRLERDGEWDRAVEMSERLAAGAGFRPQPKRSLALALAARGKAKRNRADLERAFKLLSDVALVPPGEDEGSEYEGIEVVALMEANALIPAVEAAGGSWTLDKRLVALLDTDLRIVIEWTADDEDIDLWVDEPNGERVYYGDNESSAGGQISNDMTDGYGPEEYAVRRAPKGAYKVRVDGFDADRIDPNGSGHVLIRLFRNFARDGESQTLVDADLSFHGSDEQDEDEETKPVATIRVGG